jgi:hypothetical protein
MTGAEGLIVIVGVVNKPAVDALKFKENPSPAPSLAVRASEEL